MAQKGEHAVDLEGYRSTKAVTLTADFGMRACVPERTSPQQRRWVDKDPEEACRLRGTQPHEEPARQAARQSREKTNAGRSQPFCFCRR